jgi:hypothetical protein
MVVVIRLNEEQQMMISEKLSRRSFRADGRIQDEEKRLR